MVDLSSVSTSDLQAELSRRQALGMCRCRKWSLRIQAWDHRGTTLRCAGCLSIPRECSC